jgi:hypothetical protein
MKTVMNGEALQNFSEDLCLAVCVWRVGQRRIQLGASRQHRLHVLEQTHAGFAVIRTHATLANATKWQVGAGEMHQGSVHGDATSGGVAQHVINH